MDGRDYPVDGSQLGECASCLKVTPVWDVGAYDLTRFCKACIKKYGTKILAEACNAALAAAPPPRYTTKCLRCSTPLLAGSDLMCQNCRGVYRNKFGKELKWK